MYKPGAVHATPRNITLVRGTNRVFLLDNLNLKYNIKNHYVPSVKVQLCLLLIGQKYIA